MATMVPVPNTKASTDADLAVLRLTQARCAHRAQPAPPLADAAAAYAAQAQSARELGWFGDGAPRYWKSGGASRAAVITHAPLPPDGVWASPAHATPWPFTPLGIEAEVALRLREPVDAVRAASLDPAGARDLIDAMAVSIEIVASRWVEGTQAPALAQLADLLSHGALVLGAWVDFDAARDWSTQVCRVHIGPQQELVFRGTHPMADPAFVLPAWLRHATRDGTVLAAGSVVTTGSWCGLLPAQVGEDIAVAFDGIGQALLRL
jgi:2-keto-4-pentenoate hydratase